VLLALLLLGCHPHLPEGRVVAKDHLRATTYAEGSLYGPPTRHQRPDECWRLTLQNEHGRSGELCVDRARYDAVQVGDWFRP
jgi:hypothetical protein